MYAESGSRVGVLGTISGLTPAGERERVSSETGAFNLMRAGGWLSKLGSLFGYPKIISAVL